MCPSCGSGDAWVLDTDRDHMDRVVRLRQCKFDGEEYASVEVAIPVSFYRVATKRRDSSMRHKRRTEGYRGLNTRTVFQPPDIMVKVKVIEHG